MKRMLVLIIVVIFSVSACSEDSPLTPGTNDTSALKDNGGSGGAGLPGNGTVLRLAGTGGATLYWTRGYQGHASNVYRGTFD